MLKSSCRKLRMGWYFGPVKGVAHHPHVRAKKIRKLHSQTRFFHSRSLLEVIQTCAYFVLKTNAGSCWVW